MQIRNSSPVLSFLGIVIPVLKHSCEIRTLGKICLITCLQDLPNYPITYLPMYRPTYRLTYLPTCLPIYPTYIPVCLPTYPPYLPTNLVPTYLPTYIGTGLLPTYLLIYLPTYLSPSLPPSHLHINQPNTYLPTPYLRAEHVRMTPT